MKRNNLTVITSNLLSFLMCVTLAFAQEEPTIFAPSTDGPTRLLSDQVKTLPQSTISQQPSSYPKEKPSDDRVSTLPPAKEEKSEFEKFISGKGSCGARSALCASATLSFVSPVVVSAATGTLSRVSPVSGEKRRRSCTVKPLPSRFSSSPAISMLPMREKKPGNGSRRLAERISRRRSKKSTSRSGATAIALSLLSSSSSATSEVRIALNFNACHPPCQGSDFRQFLQFSGHIRWVKSGQAFAMRTALHHGNLAGRAFDIPA